MSTYTPIASQTLSSTAASVTFSSIPQGYTDLVIVCSVKGDAAIGTIQVRLNGDTGNNYSYTRIYGTGSAVASDRSNNTSSMQLEDPGGGFNYQYIVARGFINNYSNSTTYKTMLGRGDEVANVTMATSNLWRNTSPVTTVTIFTPSNNFASGSTFSLYGIQVGQAAQKAQGGNIVTSDGTYVYHTFTSSGTFIPSQALTVDYLVVAGGGGGGYNAGGGGGAGGFLTSAGTQGGGGSAASALTLNAAKNYTVIVGGGGAGAVSDALGSNGSNSIFSTITATGGGGGGSRSSNKTGATGGSGGGGANDLGGGGSRTSSPVQGNTGGANVGDSTGGGGGGAGGAGGTGGNGNLGTGGAGLASSITGSSVTRAGGGGGGYRGASVNGGTGGGGSGSLGGGSVAATAGDTNTGSGGGGGSNATGTIYGEGAAGGSGIVIIRYAI